MLTFGSRPSSFKLHNTHKVKVRIPWILSVLQRAPTVEATTREGESWATVSPHFEQPTTSSTFDPKTELLLPPLYILYTVEWTMNIFTQNKLKGLVLVVRVRVWLIVNNDIHSLLRHTREKTTKLLLRQLLFLCPHDRHYWGQSQHTLNSKGLYHSMVQSSFMY